MFAIPEPTPPTPTLLKAEPSTSREILVTWRSTIDPRQKRQNFTLNAEDEAGNVFFRNYITTEEEAKKETQYSLKIQNLQPSTKYRISLFATKIYRGKILSSLASKVLYATTKPGEFYNFIYVVCLVFVLH